MDENGLKMSKSIGNVVAPKDIIKKYGVDTMRWWVAAHSVQHAAIPVGDKVLEGSAEVLQKFRATLRFMNGFVGSSIKRGSSTSESFLDQFMLHSLVNFEERVGRYYEDYQFNLVTAAINHFITNEVSALYLHLVKDRLYCGDASDFEAVQRTINEVYRVSCKALWPIVPFLVEESWSHYAPGESFYKSEIRTVSSWKNPALDELFQTVFETRHQLNRSSRDVNSWLLDVKISAPSEKFAALNLLTRNELCEIFQVQSVDLIDTKSEKVEIAATKRDRLLCARCRRFDVNTKDLTCQRCQRVLEASKQGV